MQYWAPSPDNLIFHTWAHLILAAHMKAGWVNDPQVALMTLRHHIFWISSLTWVDQMNKNSSTAME